MARPIKVLPASEEVRAELRRRANGRSTEHRDRFRAEIILLCAPSTRVLLAKRIIETAQKGEKDVNRLVDDGLTYLFQLK